MHQVELRPPVVDDIPHFFAQQTDPVSRELAAYALREWDRFDANWRDSIVNPDIVARTIVVDDAIAGHLISWPDADQQLFGYWLERSLWGRGIMTTAVSAFLPLVEARPLVATVATHNAASAKLLLRAGFVETQRVIADDGIPEIHFRLD